MPLNNEHIDFVIRELESRGLIYEPLRDEVVDHFCSLVEEEMESGMKFKEAFDKTLTKFGKGKRLREIQYHTIKSENFNTIAMFKNYFTTGIRNLMRYKFYSMVNIVGLAIGIASVILISLYIQNETSYDKHFADSERIYRVNGNHMFNNNPFHAGVTPAPMASALMDDYPEVEAATRIRDIQSIIFEANESSFKEPSAAYADSNLLDVLDVGLITGDPNSVLRNPNSVLLAQSTANKFFGSTDPIGQTLKTSSGTEWTVEGIFNDFPSTSHMDFTVLLPMSSFGRANNDIWLSNNFYTYVKLLPGTSGAEFETKMEDLIVKYIAPQLKSMAGVTLEQAAESGTRAHYYLMPLEDIHLKSNTTIEITPNGDVLYVYIFLSIAIFILVIACINFMNLATARSATRAKEVGVRKVMGSLRTHLVKQFLTESLLVVLMAYTLGLLIAQLFLPTFNAISGLSLAIPFGSQLFILISILGVFFVSIIAGSYPAFYLSSFKPISIMGGMFNNKGGKSWFRSSLVVFQFIISIFLIAATAVIYNQLNYIQEKNLGFEKDQVLLIHDSYLLQNQIQSFRDGLTAYAEVESASNSSFLPTSSARSDNTFFHPGNTDLEDAVNMQTWSVDENYISTFGLTLLEGRDFDPANAADAQAVILNQEAAKTFGFDDPVGQEISSFYYDVSTGNIRTDTTVNYRVIGIIEDFHYSSFTAPIKSLSLFYSPSSAYTAVKFRAKDVNKVIDLAEEEWDKTGTNQPFAYSFLGDRFNDMYNSETRTGNLFAAFAILAILIACLGLFALSAYTVDRRTKEIGIRKVMGASNSGIVYMLSKEFGKLVVLAFLLALPLIYLGADQWLEVFTYKRNPGVWLYVAPGIIALIIAIITMSFQSIRAAKSNPAQSLRNE